MDVPSLPGSTGGGMGGTLASSGGGGAGDSAKGGDTFDNPIGNLCCNVLTLICCCCCAPFLIVLFFILYLLGLITIVTPTPPDITFEKWATVCDAPLCADVAKEIFGKGGAIGDAAVATLLCMGVTAPHLTGIGGGLMAILYNKATMKVQALDALGVSPKSITEDMFSSNASALKLGANAVIVPGALAGMQALHNETGKLPWKDVFQPAIRIAREGFTIGPNLAAALANNMIVLNLSPALRKRFSNNATGALLQSGDKLVQTQLADLLTKLAEEGAEYLYEKELAEEIETNVASAGGSLKASDLSDYKPLWLDSVSAKMGNSQRIYSAPIPGAGVVLAVAVHQIKVKVMSLEAADSRYKLPAMSPKRMHNFVEDLKFALARRPELGDDEDVKSKQADMVTEAIGFADQNRDKTKPLASAQSYGIKHSPEEDFGGAQLTIVAPSGDAVSITSGLNGIFGSGFETTSGLLLNNYMDAFAKTGKPFGLDPSPVNKLAPGKRPMTSMVPTVITAGATPSPLVGAFGGSGGLPAISAVAQLITCLRMYALPHCVWNDTRVQPTFRSTTPNAVFAEHKSTHFDPAHLLRKLGYSVTEKAIASAATGIAVLKTGLLLAPNDTKHVDGSRSGE